MMACRGDIVLMMPAIMIAAMMCLQGDEQAVFAICSCHRRAVGKVRFTQERSFGWVPFAEPALCIKAVGGPFEFTIDIVPMQEGE
jgi:hypothetical protein